MPSYSRRAKLVAVRRARPEYVQSAGRELAGPVATRSGMTIYLQTQVPAGLSKQARNQFADCILRFAADLDRKTSRLEDAERAAGIDDPEITPTMVAKANERLRNSPGRIVVFAHLLAFAFAMLTPIAGAYLHAGAQWLLTIAFGFTALLAEAYAVVMPGRK